MVYKIADLITLVPAAGDMVSRCWGYVYEGERPPEIVIDEEMYCYDRYPEGLGRDQIIYMESASQFYSMLLTFGGFYLHSSAVELDGRAYLFSGPSGMGKSTHTCLWQQVFGSAAQVFNDDKPALRRLDGQWYAYGTPWCGKNGINQNKKVPLAGICFLKQAKENKIHRLSKEEALAAILAQTLHKFNKVENLDRLLCLVDALVEEIPVFELENRPEPEAARLSYETMRHEVKGN